MTNPIAIVSGASRGIGYAVAEYLCRNDYDVYLLARSAENLAVAEAKLKKLSGKNKVASVIVDLSDIETIKAFYQQIKSLPINLLFNAAGVLAPGTSTAKPNDIEQVINTNLMGTIHLTNLISENMKQHNKGYIFTVASTQGITATHEIGVYGATKAALIKYSEALNKDLAPYTIKSTCICPSVTNTDMMRGIRVADADKIPTVDIAKTVAYCLSLQPQSVPELIVIKCKAVLSEEHQQRENLVKRKIT